MKAPLRQFFLLLAVACATLAVVWVLVQALPPAWVPLALIGFAVAALGWGLLPGSDEGSRPHIAFDLVWHFLAYIALPVLMLVGGPLVLLGAALDLEDRLWQALIAGVVIATGWLTTAIFAEFERRRLKQERLRDFHKAIYAEIRNSIAVFWDDGKARRHAANIVRRMRRDEAFVPFLIQEHHDRVYEAILDEIETLPRATIDLVVAYYAHVKMMTYLADDMRADRFHDAAQIGQKRRITIYLDYFGTRERAYLLGLDTLDVIKAYADGGAAAARAMHDQINSRGAARPVRRQVSV